MYQPITGKVCHCRRGIERDNCSTCEGTGMQIDFRAIRAANKRRPCILRYLGDMPWARQYGIDGRLWDVVAPRLENYDYSSGGLPTFTTTGLKKENLI